jgi:lysozyme
MATLNAVIDLSHHNATVDFQAVQASGILGILHKATQGTGYTDPTYATRQPAATAAGLFWGAYHFGVAGDGAAQADYFLGVVKPGPQHLLVLDFEQNGQGGSMSLDDARAFVTRVQGATGRWPGLYSGSYVKQLLGSAQDPVLANCWFWLAQYGTSAVVPANWPTWTMWQYTDGDAGPQPHSVPGVGNCDRDQFNGDESRLRALWNVGPAPGSGTGA